MTDVNISKVTFVIPKHCANQNDCSEEMLIAYKACESCPGGRFQAQWAHEESLMSYQPMRNEMIVLSKFEGELYEKLNPKCILFGPQCITWIFTESYAVAMRGLIITCSGLSQEQKRSLKRTIQWMGGTYSEVLSSETTHLIANNVFYEKYKIATERGIPVMKKSWVDAVWDASMELDHKERAFSSAFKAHRLPPFANLQITSLGLNSGDEKLIIKLVTADGGNFSKVLNQSTDVLVLTKESTSSEAYKTAIKLGKQCVTPEWIIDSASRGFALPVSRYKVTSSTSSSSPVGDRPVPDMVKHLTDHKEQMAQVFNTSKQNLDSELNDARTKLTTALSQKDELFVALNDLNRKLDHAKRELEMITEMKDANSKLDLALKECTAAHESLKKSLQKQEQFTQSICDQNNKLQEKISGLEEEKVSSSEKIRDLETKLEERENGFKQMSIILETCKEKNRLQEENFKNMLAIVEKGLTGHSASMPLRQGAELDDNAVMMKPTSSNEGEHNRKKVGSPPPRKIRKTSESKEQTKKLDSVLYINFFSDSYSDMENELMPDEVISLSQLKEAKTKRSVFKTKRPDNKTKKV